MTHPGAVSVSERHISRTFRFSLRDSAPQISSQPHQTYPCPLVDLKTSIASGSAMVSRIASFLSSARRSAPTAAIYGMNYCLKALQLASTFPSVSAGLASCCVASYSLPHSWYHVVFFVII